MAPVTTTPYRAAMLRVPTGDLVVLTVMVIAMAFTTPCGAAMLRVPAGDPVVLMVMVIAMAFTIPCGAAMLCVPAGNLVVLTVMVITMAFTTPCGDNDDDCGPRALCLAPLHALPLVVVPVGRLLRVLGMRCVRSKQPNRRRWWMGALYETALPSLPIAGSHIFAAFHRVFRIELCSRPDRRAL